MRFWIAAVLFLALVVLALAMGPRAIDWNAYRSDIEAAAVQLSGHDVTIGGPIKIALVPRPVLTVRDVSIAGRTREAIDFTLTANQADVTMAIGPLLAGRPVIRELTLRRPALTMDGDNSRRLRSWPPRWQDWAAPLLQLDINAIDIIDGKIELLGESPERTIGLSDLTLGLSLKGPDGPLEAAGLFKTKRHRFTTSAEFSRPDKKGVRGLKLSIEAQNGIEETTTLRLNGKIDEQGVHGRLALAGPDLQHGLAAIAAATHYPSTFRSIATSQPFAIEGQIDADRTGVRADELQLRLSDKLGNGKLDLQLHPQSGLDLSLELPTLRLSNEVGLDDFLPLDLLSKLQVPPGEIDIRLREVAFRGDAARQASVKLRTGADRATVVERAKVALPGLVDVQFEGGLFAGDVGPRLKGKLSAVGDDLGSSLVWLDLIEDRDRGNGWRSFSLESDVDVSSVEIALAAIDFRLDSARLNGKAGLRFSERRQLALDVDVERADLDLYMADVEPNEALAGLAARLSDLDSDIDARFKRLIWQGIHLEDGAVTVRAEQGRLTLEQIMARTVGDTVLTMDGKIDLDNRSADLGAELISQHPVRALRHLELDSPLTASRLQPLKLSGEIRGTLERFEFGVMADYDEGKAIIGGQAGWIENRPWYDATVNAEHPDHQALAGQFGLAPLVPAGDAEGALELAGKISLDTTTPWIVSGSAKLGPTTFTGSLAFEEGLLTGPFEAKVSIGSPRKDSVAPLLILSGLKLAGDWTPARWLGRLPRAGLRTAWLDKAEGTFSLASKGGLVGDGLTLNATLRDGLLFVEQLEATPWQGRLLAELTLTRRRDQPFAAVAIDLDQIDAAELAAWLGVKSGISGPLDLDLEASSVGRTPYDMVAGLAGEMTIKVGPGALKGLGIPALRQFLAEGAAVGASAGRSLELPFRGIDAKAALQRGILRVEDGRMSIGSAADGGTDATIDGTVDLLLWIVDLALSSTTSGGSDKTAANASRVYRVVGRPDRPSGFSVSEN